MDLDALKDETLGLIAQYNSDSSHRQVTPVGSYGEPLGDSSGIRIYWAHWSDDLRSTHQVGFMYSGGRLHSMSSAVPDTLDQAIADLLSQLDAIPPDG
jgi:hypothetical protein